MSFSVGLIMVLASVWIARLACSYPRRGILWTVWRSSPTLWGGYVSAILCLVYSVGMSVSDMLAYGTVSFWLGLNLVYSSCFLVIPASVVFSGLGGAIFRIAKAAEAAPFALRSLAKGVFAVCLPLLGLGLYASIYEPNAVRLETVNLVSPKLSSSAGIRIVQLSDLHISRLGLREKRVLGMVQSAAPDLILLTGDLVGRPRATAAVREFLSRLQANEGVFAVASDSDERNNISSLLEGTGVRLLHDEALTVGARQGGPFVIPAGPISGEGVAPGQPRIQVVGITGRRANFRRAFTSVKADEFTAVIGYSPWARHSVTSADLLLVGQNHGGQISLAALRDRFISHLGGDPSHPKGLYREGNLTMYVSRGVGMEGNDAPRIRFLVPPEVTLIVVQGEKTGITR